MRHGLTTFIALPLVMGFLGRSSMSTTQKGAAIGGLGGAAAGGSGRAVPFAIRSRGRLSVVRSEREDGALIGNQLQGQEEVQQQQQEQINRQSSELKRQRGTSENKEAGRVLTQASTIPQEELLAASERQRQHIVGVCPL